MSRRLAAVGMVPAGGRRSNSGTAPLRPLLVNHPALICPLSVRPLSRMLQPPCPTSLSSLRATG